MYVGELADTKERPFAGINPPCFRDSEQQDRTSVSF